MTTFDKQAVAGETFLYQKGRVNTVTPWGRPSYQKVKNFLTHVQENTSILEDYDVYIMGGVLFDFNTTWDLDMCLVGGTQTDIKLEEDLDFLTDLALNTFNMLVDVSWYESRPQNLVYSEMQENNFLQQNIQHKKVGYVKKQIGENIQESDLRTYTDATTLTEYLIQRSYGAIEHTEKMVNKVQNNQNPTTITTFSVNEFLSTDENHFINNTNR